MVSKQDSQTNRYVFLIYMFLLNSEASIEFHWEELWKSFISLLDFLSSKVNTSSGKSEQLVQEMVMILAFSLRHAEAYLGSPQSVHQLVVRYFELFTTAQSESPLVRTGEIVGDLREATGSL